jgi:hypothetical protein
MSELELEMESTTQSKTQSTTKSETQPDLTAQPIKAIVNPEQHRRMEEMPQALIGSELLEEENEISSTSDRVLKVATGSHEQEVSGSSNQ